MVGRSLIGRPWDILQIRAAVDGTISESLRPEEKAKVAVTHYRDIIDFYPKAKGVRFARKHLAGYCDHAGLQSTDPLRIRVCQGLDPDDVAKALSSMFLQEAEAA